MKAIEILTKLSNSMKNNEGIINWDCSIDFFNKTNEAIKELQAFKLKNALDCGKLLCLQTEVETLKTLLDRTRESEESLSLEFKSFKKENTRLKKQLSKDHHIECGCSFCKPVDEKQSCENCKHYDGTQTCNKFVARSSYNYKDFCCNKWELKC